MVKFNIPIKIINIVQGANYNNTAKIISAENLTDKINVTNEMRHGDALSSFIFNHLIRIIETIKQEAEYKINADNVNILCYTDDTVLLADNEDNLPRLFHKINTADKNSNMILSTDKTKSMVISKTRLRCKLEINGTTIEHVMSFNFV